MNGDQRAADGAASAVVDSVAFDVSPAGSDAEGPSGRATTIAEITEQVAEQLYVPIRHQRLVWRGCTLDPLSTCHDNDIRHCDTVQLVIPHQGSAGSSAD